MAPTIPSIQQRLTTTSSLLLERSRVLSLNLRPSPSSTAAVVRNLTAIRAELAQLAEQAEIESSGLVLGGKALPKGKGGASDTQAELDRLGEGYDRLLEMLAEDDVGRDKAKALQREKKDVVPSPVPSPSPEENAPSAEPPTFQISPPTPFDGPFRDNPSPRPSLPAPYAVDEDDADTNQTPHEMLSQQQMMMDDQDERLNLLSKSIGRQNHLSVQIGSELDMHHELLEETDHAMDRTADRLNKAKRRLDKVAGGAKQYGASGVWFHGSALTVTGSTITIVVLIVILLLLIIVFKT